jgi:dipeptide/tripeptide permease
MEDKETEKGIIDKLLQETKKPGFFQALGVFFVCVIIGLIAGLIYDTLQLSLTLGVGLGIVWMGVAYFNQKE